MRTIHAVKEAINPDAARQFLKALDPRAKEFTFQSLAEGGSGSELNMVLHGSFEKLEGRLRDLNMKGAGIFVTINRTDLKGRKKENILEVRAVFFDQDSEQLGELAISPSILIKTKRGFHGYYLFDEAPPLFRFSEIQKRIANSIGSDPSVVDLPRVMRLPGFYHNKNLNDKFLVRILNQNGQKYGVDEIESAFRGQVISSDNVQPEKAYIKWVESLPIEEGRFNRYGGRNNTALLLIREGLGCHAPSLVIRDSLLLYCSRSGLNNAEALKMLEKQIAVHENSPFSSFRFGSQPEKPSIADIADSFLLNCGFLDAFGTLLLRNYRQSFYSYTGRKYEKVSEEELANKVMRYLRGEPFLRKLALSRTVKEIVANLIAKCEVVSADRAPFWLNSTEENKDSFLSLANGLLNVSKFVLNREICLVAHSANYFNLNQLDIHFCELAKAPLWHEFLAEVLDLPEQRELQKWFGLNLIGDTSFQRMLFMLGEGANGKSIICNMLQWLLGKNNYSSVPLEAFDPKRTFMLAALDFKLANIVSEIGQSNRVSESILKQLAAGETLTVERKNKDPFEMQVTARLTFATNKLPVFQDMSEGIWRRLLILPFTRVFAEAKQNRDLLKKKYWSVNDEFPGILLWALEGYRLLLAEGFVSSENMKAYLIEHRETSNPAKIFLQDHVETGAGEPLSSLRLYSCYRAYVQDRGTSALGMPSFNQLVSQLFQVQKPILRRDGSQRSRFWIGIKLANDTHGTAKF